MGTAVPQCRNGKSKTSQQQILNAGRVDPECKYGMLEIIFQTKSLHNLLPVIFSKFANAPLIHLEIMEMTTTNLNSTLGKTNCISQNELYCEKKHNVLLCNDFWLHSTITLKVHSQVWDYFLATKRPLKVMKNAFYFN